MGQVLHTCVGVCREGAGLGVGGGGAAATLPPDLTNYTVTKVTSAQGQATPA